MRQRWLETDIERGHDLCCFLFQYRANTRRSKNSSYAALAPTLPLLSIGSKVAYSAVPISPPPTPDPGMAPMLPLEPCYSAAHFKRRPLSFILKIFAQMGPAQITLPGVSLRFFHWDNSNIPQREGLHGKQHGWKNRMYESLCYV